VLAGRAAATDNGGPECARRAWSEACSKSPFPIPLFVLPAERLIRGFSAPESPRFALQGVLPTERREPAVRPLAGPASNGRGRERPDAPRLPDRRAGARPSRRRASREGRAAASSLRVPRRG